jgi:hypothetical protein
MTIIVVKLVMETAIFRFTDSASVSLEFDANISTTENFTSDLLKALQQYIQKHPNKVAALHMLHEKRWMPLNWDGSAQTIVAKTSDPMLWAERMSQEILNLWQDMVRHSDQIDSLLRSAVKVINDSHSDP